MEPALDADLTQESAPRTYTGPQRFTPTTTAVVELVRTGGFEAVLTWAVGVDEERPFLVSTLESPARLVIDVKSSVASDLRRTCGAATRLLASRHMLLFA